MELTPSVVEVVRLQSTAGYLFAADNVRTQRPFVSEVGIALAKQFDGADFAVQAGDRPLWFLRQGAVRFSDKRRVSVSMLAGGAHEFTVTVEGTSEDARDVLREAWTKIGEIEGAEESAFTDYPGSFTNSTTAVVKLPVTCTELIPPLAVMTSFAKARLGAALLQPPGATPFRLNIPLSIAVRGLAIERALVIEPRFTSLADDRVYFTVSPLSSDDHLEMLRLLVSRVAAAPDAG